MRALTFSSHPLRGGSQRRHFVTEDEIRVVLERLPGDLWHRLAGVHFNDCSRGSRCLGYVRSGLNEIALCALPHRVSLSGALRHGQCPSRFGAIRGAQWPTLAVRRFMLYNVFLHELGHLQIIDSKAKNVRRKFASETRAQDFAEYWCHKLWSRPFDHPDPVHNSPHPQEIAALRVRWSATHNDYKKGLLREQERNYEEAVRLFARAVERYPRHAMALERLGILTYAGNGTAQSNVKAIDLLEAAVRTEPTLFHADVFLGLALSRESRQAEARRCFEQAMRLDSYPPLAMAVYADALADWSLFEEAESLFQKAIKRDSECVLAIRDYARCLVRDGHPQAEQNLGRAIALYERGVAVDSSDAESHFRLGDALLCVDGELDRGIRHLERALQLDPGHDKAATLLAECAQPDERAREN